MNAGRRQRTATAARYWWSVLARTWKAHVAASTVPALQSVHQARGRAAAVAWALLAVVGAACTAHDVWVATAAYMQRPVLTRLTADPAAALAFPAVTVCSLNRARCDRVAALWRQSQLQKERTPEAGRLLRLLQMARCPQAPPGGGRHLEDADNEESTFNRRMDFIATYLSFSKEQRALMGDSFRQLVISCQFSGTSCLNERKYFTRSIHSGYGNCYTFTTKRKTVLPGKDYGLSLQLSLSRDQQLRAALSPEVGARLLVHSPQLAPMPDEGGLNVPPGVATSVALQQVDIIRKELPYMTNCSSTWERTWYASYVGETYKYSLERCRRICLQIAFEEKCNCAHPNYMDLDRGNPPCNLTSVSSDSQCAFAVLEEFEYRLRTCSCNVDCSEVNYQTSISTAIWPTDSTWCAVAKRFNLVDSCENVTEENHHTKYHPEKQIIKDNALKLDVYFENLRVQRTIQTAAYEPQAFVASLGGALSLYLGISLLMLVEVVELIIRVISDLYNHFKKQTRTQPKVRGHNLNNRFAHTDMFEDHNYHLRPPFVW